VSEIFWNFRIARANFRLGGKIWSAKAIGTIENFSAARNVNGIGTGFPDLGPDDGPFARQRNDRHRARPSMGQLAAMNVVEHAVLEEKLPVAVFSLEMSAMNAEFTRADRTLSQISDPRSFSKLEDRHRQFSSSTACSTTFIAATFCPCSAARR